MKNIVRSTYHFVRDPADEAPSETGVRREISETINLLALGQDGGLPLSPVDLRVVSAMREGFTAAQFVQQLDQIERRWAETDRDLVRLVADAEEVHHTGMEPNSRERNAAEVAS